MKSVTFVAQTGGDCECFVWRAATEADRIAVVGAEEHQRDREMEEDYQREHARDFQRPYDAEAVERALRVIYPNDVCRALGVEDGNGKRYRFTITAEEVP